MVAYTTVKDVVEQAGVFERVDIAEVVGTGNGTTVAFNLSNQTAVSGTLKVWVAGTLKTEATDYTVDYDRGIITFLASKIPAAAAEITATYWYFLIGLDSTIVTNAIANAEEYVEVYTGRAWTTKTATAEKYDGNGSNSLLIRPDHTPVISVTTLTIDGTSVTPSTLYLYNNRGEIKLSATSQVSYFTTATPQNVVLTYTYGEATTPQKIKNLAATLAASDCLRLLMGSTSMTPGQFSIGAESISAGELVARLSATFARLDMDIEYMLRNIKKRIVVA